jgi:hypothetical protein
LLFSLLSIGSAQSVSDVANRYKIILDVGVEEIDTVSYAGTTYHVIKYNNLLPYASGVEIFSSSGKRVVDSKLAKSVLVQVAWKEAASQISPSDIDTLKGILSTSNKIYNAVAPVASATNSLVSFIGKLKSYCVDVPLLGKKCAWDAIKASFPEISMFERELVSLNRELNEWKSASAEVQSALPSVISGLESLKAGGEMTPELQSNIQKSMAAFGRLKAKTDSIADKLSDVISMLSNAETSIRSASSTPLIGGVISKFADYVGALNSKVKSLRNQAISFSRELSEQSSKLSNVLSTAEKRTNELYGWWNSRRNAPMMVYATLGGLLAVMLVVFGIVYRRKRVGIKTEKTKVEKVKAERVKFSSKRVTGIVIAVIGAILLLYSFLMASSLFSRGFRMEEVGVKVLIFIFMLGIGGYLTGKGVTLTKEVKPGQPAEKATLTKESRIIGGILAAIGLYMLIVTYMKANAYVNAEFAGNESFLLLLFKSIFTRILFFVCMIGIGGYLTGKGVGLIDHPMVNGFLLTSIGVIMLLFSFIAAYNIVGVEFAGPPVLMLGYIIKIIFLIFMISIGGYLTGRGSSEIMKIS